MANILAVFSCRLFSHLTEPTGAPKLEIAPTTGHMKCVAPLEGREVSLWHHGNGEKRVANQSCLFDRMVTPSGQLVT